MILIRTPSSESVSAPALFAAIVGLMVIMVASTVLGTMPTMIAVGIPSASAGLIFLIRRPTATLGVMVAVEVTDVSGVLAQRVPVPLTYVSLAVGCLAIGRALRDPVMRGRLNRGTVWCGGLASAYLVTQLLALVGSQNVDASITSIQNSLLGCAFLMAVLVLTQLTGKPWTVAAAVVIPLAVISVLCAISLVASGGAMSFGGFATVTSALGELATTPRFAGPLGDSNFWGRHLILALPLSGALIVRAVGRRQWWITLGWAAALLALLAGVYLTQSRGTLMAAVVAFLVWVLASGPVARRRGLMSLPLVALIVLVPGVGNRMIALAIDVKSGGKAVDPSVVGRMNAQEIAWAMFRDRPVFGFGPDVFALSVPRYAGTVDTAFLRPADAAHNLYAQFAAESGIVGLVGWIVFAGGFVVYLATRMARMSSGGADAYRSLMAAVLGGLVAWSFASVFLQLSYLRTLAIMLAVAGALASTAESSPARTAPERHGGGRREVPAMVVGAAVGAVVLLMNSHTTHVVSQMVTLQPKAQVSWDRAYALDIKTRDAFLPTYAAMMAPDTDDRVTATADSVRGVITVSLNESDMASAREDLVAALDGVHARLAGFGAEDWYTVTPVGSPTVHVGTERSTFSTLLAVALGTLVAAALVGRPRRRTRRSLEGVRT